MSGAAARTGAVNKKWNKNYKKGLTVEISIQDISGNNKRRIIEISMLR